MATRTYINKNFADTTLRTIYQAADIIEEFMSDGYELTLRQLYYQMVARDLIPNKQTEYNRLGRIVSDARLAGMIDWEAIIDRTRNLEGNAHWTGPDSILRSSANQFRVDTWTTQPRRVEVFVEKDALVGVIGRVCERLDVDYFSCRGYTSQSEMWKASQRIYDYARNGQPVTILHLGDHDPSGLDMTRDIRERLEDFICQDYMEDEGLDEVLPKEIRELFEVNRIALNREQIDEYGPPPNPAKVSDSRFNGYQQKHGAASWELDALNPRTLEALVEEHVTELREDGAWNARVRDQNDARLLLKEVADNLEDIQDYLENR